MRIRSILTVAMGLAVLTGCDKDVSATQTDLQEAALIRYVNAVPDTSSLDFRFVDGSIELSPQYANVPFRTFTAYQRVRPGARQIKVFTNPAAYGNDIAVAVQQHVDTTFTFEPNARYTIISYGFARSTASPRHRLVIIRDELPGTLTTTQVGARTIHAAPGLGSVDLYVRTSETPAAISGTPAAANLAPLGATAWLNLAPRPVGALLYRWDITAPGATVAIPLSTSTGLPGVVGTALQNPLAGFQVGRSVVSVVILPASVVGSRAPQTAAFLSATALFMPDKALDTTEP